MLNNTIDNYQLLIRKLDAFIRRFYLNKIIRGTLYTLALLGTLFLLFTVLENYFYFSKTGRKILYYSFIGTSLGAFFYWVGRHLLAYYHLGKVISHEQAAQIIGQHFKAVKDKLLNILQLKQMVSRLEEAELIEASIQQKSEQIKPISFQSAIDLTRNKKYLKYALVPLLLILSILLLAPGIIRNSTARIIANDKEFEKPLPFHFHIKNQALNVVQYGDFTLEVEADGDELPDGGFVEIGGYEYSMKSLKPGLFSYRFRNVSKDLTFRLKSGEVRSKPFVLRVIPKPHILNFEARLDYPRYTGRKSEILNNIGDFIVPAGTRIIWTFETEYTDEIAARFSGDKKNFPVEQRGENLYELKRKVRHNQGYRLYVSNHQVPNGDSATFNINVIPDQYPLIEAQEFMDSTVQNERFFAGKASDDYGIRKLLFKYTLHHAKDRTVTKGYENLPVKGTKSTLFDYRWTLDSLHLEPGDVVEYYFEVWDNDAVNGSKSAKTSIQKIKLPTLDELKNKTEKNAEDIKKALEKNIHESKKIRQQLKKLREKLLQKKNLNWQDKKDLERLLEKQKELQKQFEKIQKKLQENTKNAQKTNPDNQEMQEKQEQLQKQFKDAMSQEMKDLMKKIEDLLQELKKDDALQMTEEFEQKNLESEKDMDRLLELFKQLEVEKDLKDKIDELKKLAEEQEKLAEATKKEEKPNDELKKKQENIEKKLEKLQKEMEKLQKKNEALEHPKKVDIQPEKLNEPKKDMEQSQKEMKAGKNKKASKSQKNAAQKMKEMADQMQSQMESQESDQQQEDLKALRQILENILTLSFDEEDLIKHLDKLQVTSPAYVKSARKQFDIKKQFLIVEDSLIALSHRVVQIEKFILDQVGKVNTNIKSSIDKLEARNKPLASNHQHRVLTALNELALMLSEAMNQMQKQMAQKMPGNQMCNKPGGSGKPGNVPKDKISSGQKKLKEDMGKMMKDAQKGKKPGSKAFAQAAARQAAMRKALEQMQRERQQQGKGSKELQKIIDEMNKMEEDLVNKRLTHEMLKRQQDILTRLLESDRAERQRKYEENRKSETAQEVERKLPPSLQEYLRQREKEVELYNNIPPDLRPYYKYLVEQYYKSLKS